MYLGPYQLKDQVKLEPFLLVYVTKSKTFMKSTQIPKGKSPPKPPIPGAIMAILRTSSDPASMSTPASLYVRPPTASRLELIDFNLFAALSDKERWGFLENRWENLGFMKEDFGK